MKILHKITGKILFDGNIKSLQGANLQGVNLQVANLQVANLRGADLRWADLREANLQGADLRQADLREANLQGANLQVANLQVANLREADLQGANLRGAYLQGANLQEADLRWADLQEADLRWADLKDTKGLVKIVGVEIGNTYWKRFNKGLINNNYQFKVGINNLQKGETFASDPRALCSYPGFHFASRSWCEVNCGDRPLEARIRIPEGAEINEPWAADGKASASSIEILQVFDVETGKDVTEDYR